MGPYLTQASVTARGKPASERSVVASGLLGPTLEEPPGATLGIMTTSR